MPGSKALLGTGLIGAVLAALCCFISALAAHELYRRRVQCKQISVAPQTFD